MFFKVLLNANICLPQFDIYQSTVATNCFKNHTNSWCPDFFQTKILSDVRSKICLAWRNYRNYRFYRTIYPSLNKCILFRLEKNLINCFTLVDWFLWELWISMSRIIETNCLCRIRLPAYKELKTKLEASGEV